jgi:NitT/TauT family transport system ATP-binding protein
MNRRSMLEVHNFVGYRGVFNLRVDYFYLIPGEIVFLYGRSGCGKTTFLDMLAGVVSTKLADECRITFGNISYVMHSSTLLPWLTIEDHLKVEAKLRNKDCDIDLFVFLCDQFGLDPSTYHKRPGQLSLGMRQRVEIAKSIAFGSRLILIDEGLSGLDIRTKRVVIESLLDIAQKRVTIVGVAHQIQDMLSLAQRVYFLENGCFEREISLRSSPRERLIMPIEELMQLNEAQILLQYA